MIGAAQAEEKPLTPEPFRLTDGARQRLEEAGPVIVKVFVAALRERFSDEKAAELRKFIDPRYLKEHGLQEGVFPIQRVVTGDHSQQRVLRRSAHGTDRRDDRSHLHLNRHPQLFG